MTYALNVIIACSWADVYVSSKLEGIFGVVHCLIDFTEFAFQSLYFILMFI